VKVEFINPFAKAVLSVLEKEVPADWTRGQLSLKPSPFEGWDMNVIIGVAGDVEGQVILTMSSATAKNVVSTMMGETVSELDELSKSAIGELGNMITGNASIALAENGYRSVLTPPSLIQGKELIVTTVMPVLSIPMRSEKGDITVCVALRDIKKQSV
jgi:chemotaxis protein CheX